MANYKKFFTISLLGILLIFPLFSFSQGCRQPEVPIPGLQTTCLPALPAYIVAIYNFALMVIGIICFGALLYGGLRYLTSVGKPAAIGDARDQIFSAILGLIILFSAYLILRTINPELVILREKPLETKYCTTSTINCTSNANCPADYPNCGGGMCNTCPSQTCNAGRCNYSLNICDGSTPCPPLQCIEGICSVPASGNWASGCFYSHQNECEDPKVNCKWCPKCSGNKTNNWGFDKCVDEGTDCGYHCVKGEEGGCGANCEKNADCGAGKTCVNCICQ